MRKGKIILISLIMLVSGNWAYSQTTYFPRCYKYHSSENLNNSLFHNLYSEATSHVRNANIDSIKYSSVQMNSLSCHYDPLSAALLETIDGVTYYFEGNNSDALKHFLKALAIYSEEEFYTGLNSLLNNIAIIFSMAGDSRSSKKYLLRAIEINEREGLDHYSLFSYNLAEVELELGNYDASLNILKELLRNENINLNQISPLSIAGTIISAYNKLGKPEEAQNWINRGYLEMDEERYSDIDRLNFYTSVMEYHLNNNEYEKVINIASDFGIDERYTLPDQHNHLEYLCRSYIATGDYESAWKYENIIRDIDAANSIVNRQEIIDLLMVEYEVARHQRRKESIEQEINLNNKRQEASYKLMITFLIVLIAFIILFLVLLRMRRIRNKSRNQFSNETDKFAAVNRELIKTNKELEKENKLLDTLISVFAHDLINPFQAILGFSRLMVDDFENLHKDSIIEYSNMLNETSFQLNQLLINLQSIATIQEGRDKLEMSDVGVKNMADRVTALYKPLAEKKKINILSKINNSVKVHINPNIFQSVLRNVLNNAIKFSEEGGEIRIYAIEAGKDVDIIIEDDGTGMDEEVRTRIMNGSYLTSKPGTGREKGSGLGLTICIELLEMNNATLEIDNNREEGTTVIMKIQKADA